MAKFDPAFNATMGTEGGYANDPNDHGGETYAGISRNNFPNWEGWKIIDYLKILGKFPANIKANTTLPGMVKDFYRKNFWNVIRGDEIESQDIANQLFDMAVNAGNGAAIKLAEIDLNVPHPDSVLDDETLKLINNQA